MSPTGVNYYELNLLKAIKQLTESFRPLQGLTIMNNYTMNEIQIWDFNLDDYLFEYLENGYDIFIIDYKHILYIDLYINYNLEDIEYINGLTKYIEYKEKVAHE